MHGRLPCTETPVHPAGTVRMLRALGPEPRNPMGPMKSKDQRTMCFTGCTGCTPVVSIPSEAALGFAVTVGGGLPDSILWLFLTRL